MFGSACDCAEKCLKEYAGQVALCYIDPPFCTGGKFSSGDRYNRLYNDMPQNLNAKVSVHDNTFCVQSESDEEFSLASGYMHDGVFRAVYTNAGNEITLPETTGKRAVSVDNKKDSLAFYVID